MYTSIEVNKIFKKKNVPRAHYYFLYLPPLSIAHSFNTFTTDAIVIIIHHEWQQASVKVVRESKNVAERKKKKTKSVEVFRPFLSYPTLKPAHSVIIVPGRRLVEIAHPGGRSNTQKKTFQFFVRVVLLRRFKKRERNSERKT